MLINYLILDNMKEGNEGRKSMYIIILIMVIIFLCIHKCKPDKDVIIIPAKEGNFTDTIIVHKTINDTILLTKEVVKYKDNIKYWNLENDSLKSIINNLANKGKTDSIIKLVDKELSLKAFNGNFEDEIVKIGYSGIVKGEVKAIDIDYKIKPQEVKIPSKLEFFAGPRLQVKTEPHKFNDAYNLGIDLYIRNKDMLYNANINSDKQVSIGVSKKLF